MKRSLTHIRTIKSMSEWCMHVNVGFHFDFVDASLASLHASRAIVAPEP